MPESILVTNQQNDVKESFLTSALRRFTTTTTSRKLGRQPMSSTEVMTTTTATTNGATGNNSFGQNDAKDLNPSTAHPPTDYFLRNDDQPLLNASPPLASNNPFRIRASTNPFLQQQQQKERAPDSGYHSESQSRDLSSTTSSPSSPPTSTVTDVPANNQIHNGLTESPAIPSAHPPRIASASAAVVTQSTPHVDTRPKLPVGTMSRHTLQRTRTTDMLLSPTMTLARPSSVVLPPLPPITLNLPVRIRNSTLVSISSLFLPPASL